MRPFSCFSLLFVLLLSGGAVKAQDSAFHDTIYLMSGQQLIANVIGVGEPLINYRVQKKKKVKIQQIDAYRVFSIRFGDGRDEFMVYEPDTAKNRYYSVEQMRSFVYGQQDALKHFKGGVYNVLGLALGIPTGYSVLGEGGAVLGLPAPLFFSIPVLLNRTIPKKAVRNLSYLEDEQYREGFKRVIRGKRFFSVLKSSAFGMVAGFSAYQLTK